MRISFVKKLLAFVVTTTLSTSVYSAHSGYDAMELFHELVCQKQKQPYSCSYKPIEKILTQHDINLNLYNAANQGNYKKVEQLLNLPEDQMRPDQQGISWALSGCIRHNDPKMISTFIDRPEGTLRPDQDAINRAFCKAVRNSNKPLIEFFLNRSPDQLQPDQQGMHLAVSISALHGYQSQLEWFLDKPQSVLHPNQDDINKALFIAAGEGHYAIITSLVARNDQLKPDQSGIIKAYKQALRFKKELVASKLLFSVKANKK